MRARRTTHVRRTVRGAFALFVSVVAAGMLLAHPGRADEPEKSGPPFADGPDGPEVAPKPKTRAWTVVEGPFTFLFSFVPGIPEKDAVVEVMMSGLEKPSVPDPKWGTAVPLMDARFVAEHLSPAGEVVRRYLMHPIPLAQGKYGFHLTPEEVGIHGLRVVGRLADGRRAEANLKMPVDVWPLPKELEGSGDQGGTVRRTVVRKPITSK